MKQPPYNEAEKCIKIRKRSKRGIDVSQSEHEYCMSMLAKFPKWYSQTEARVFNETVPFGSTARYPEEPPKSNRGS